MDTFNPDLNAAQQAMERAAEPKPGTVDEVGPSVSPGDTNPFITLGWDENFIKEMWGQVELAIQRTERQGQRWKTLLEAYIPKVEPAGTPEEPGTNTHFRNTHTKIGQLFLTNPEIRVSDLPISMSDVTKPAPMTGLPISMADVLAVKQEVLNQRLGPNGVDAARLADELLFDILQVSGMGWSKIGYTATTRMVEQPVMGPDPNFVPPPPMPGSMLGLQPPAVPPMVPQMTLDPATGQMVPKTEKVPVVIHSEIYWRRFSPWKGLIDPYCHSTRYDKDASWLGHRFTMRKHQAIRTLRITEEDAAESDDSTLRYKHKTEEGQQTNVVIGIELFIKATAVDPAVTHPNQPDFVPHPQQLYQLVLLNNIKDRPIIWRECVDQTFNERGELTEDSLDRFPIQIATLRDMTDSAFPEADAAFTNSIIKTRNTGRRQQIRIRNASIQKMLYDPDAFEEGEVSALKNPDTDHIAVKPSSLQNGVEKVLVPTPTVKVSQDSYRLDADLRQDNDETLGINANSAGATNDTVRAATEIATVQQAVAGRVKKERDRFMHFYVECARILDTYIARYTTQTEYVRLTGPDGAQRIQTWNGQMVSGRWLYQIAPDSQLQVDTPQDRQYNLNLYNMVAKDPLVDRRPVLRRVFQQSGYDPGKCIMNPAAMAMNQQPEHGGPANKKQAGTGGGNEGGPQQGNHRENQQAGAGPDQPQE